ncbi:methylmalonyl-CoA mutase small subunit [Adhaeribacter aerolatus]|uniref:Methylmalonyl-CoA mutase small subunit n=1 Tax=Adhaeribacter aerolatus TaxID=670289 RepID=A0A512B3A3_9BACT|nr:methylmalonyl-CoA mutase family protein [Adhaeribacter aerolatus]GEO06443.1 methylmalonyl-CoA mutase small subunit [Adhaeribacter aerolatus]
MEQKNIWPSLLSDFPAVSAAAWAEKTEKDLKGIDPATLNWITDEGITVKPFYTTEDLAAIPQSETLPGKFPYIRGHKTDTNHWQNLQEFVVTQDSRSAVDKAVLALAGGANGIHFKLQSGHHFDFEYAITHLDILKNTFCFSTNTQPANFLKEYFEHLKKKGLSLHGLKGFLNQSQPLAPETWSLEFNQLEEIVELTKDAVDFYGVTVNGAIFGNRGASMVQEIAFTLSAAVNYTEELTKRGIALTTVLRNMQFLVSTGTNYFFEIAKLRALRWLWAGIVKAIAPEPEFAAYLRLHAQTTSWSATTFDPHTNILRTTTEAMSAIIGGCDSVSVAPFDSAFNQDNPFAERIARNIPLILQHEAYLHQAIDPAAGSYYLGTLTRELAEKAWILFQAVAQQGGYAQALQSGFIQGQINTTAEEKFRNIASGKEVLVGTNKFANKLEKMPFDIEALLQSPSFDATRASYPFEVMRLAAMLHFQKKQARPKAIIAIIGQDIQEHIHAAFAKEFFDCGDFQTEMLHFDSVKAALEKLLFTDCKVLVFSSSDSDYTHFSKSFVAALKNHKHRPALILAAPPENMKEELEENGFDAHIFQNCNALSIIGRIQERLLTSDLPNFI